MLNRCWFKVAIVLNLCFGAIAFAADSQPGDDRKAKIVQEYNTLQTNQSGLFAKCGFLIANQTNMPTLHGMISNLAKKLEIDVPWLLIFQGNSLWDILEACGCDNRAGAFTIGLRQNNCALFCIGEDLIKKDLFTSAGLEAVLAHELAHVHHDHYLKEIVFFLVVKLLVHRFVSHNIIVSIPAVETLGMAGDDWALDLLTYCLVKNALSRYFEKEADMTAARIIDDPVALGKALDVLMQNFREKPHLIYDFVTELFSDHPLLKNRKAYLKQAALDKEEQG